MARHIIYDPLTSFAARRTLRETMATVSMRRRVFAAAPPDVEEGSGQWLRLHRRAMACRFEITLDARDAHVVPAAQAALNHVDAIEAQLTVFRETSDLVRINRAAGREAVACEPALFALLLRCEALSAATHGAFDITSTPLSRCWGFLRREGRIPTADEIAAARRAVGMALVTLDRERSTVRFREPGVELNLGAIGKGHALDCVAVLLRRAGVQHALLSAGQSSLLAIGGRGRGWSIDLVSPQRPSPLARVWLRDAALGTSGAGTQFIVDSGRRYGHVIDPRTGESAAGVLSASVVCRSAADADALSTAFLVAGAAAAHDFCQRHHDVLALATPDEEAAHTFVIGHHAGADLEDA
jgi:FAD:protein FMN transferase